MAQMFLFKGYLNKQPTFQKTVWDLTPCSPVKVKFGRNIPSLSSGSMSRPSKKENSEDGGVCSSKTSTGFHRTAQKVQFFRVTAMRISLIQPKLSTDILRETLINASEEVGLNVNKVKTNYMLTSCQENNYNINIADIFFENVKLNIFVNDSNK
jgi:hypothetical protein